MDKKEKFYIIVLLLHVVIGILLYLIPSLSKLYSISIILFGLYYVLKTRNKNNEVLLVASYIVGSEALLRMTGGSFLYEFSKYGVMVFLAIGMYYNGFSKNSIPFWIYLLLLLPGVIIATETLSFEANLRTTIAFNISGPACLGVASIYTYNRKILFSQLNTILLSLGLPIVSTTVYLIFYTPDLDTILTGTGSNSALSGGFGPNQVSTVLGIGMFIFFSRLILFSKSKLLFIINLIIVFNITYRGLITFSRGGMTTGFVMIILFLIFLYMNINSYAKNKLYVIFVFMSFVFALTWIYTSSQTGGLIDKRYANKDAMGRVKKDKFTGRAEIASGEIDAFKDNPVFGIGVAKGLEIRKEKTGNVIASHNEITRTISEHGTMGIAALFIVFLTPIFLYLDNKHNIYIFCFLIFWLLTINHAAMRIAAPAFVYSLSLLKVYMDEESPLHRK